jgi:WD40 repeat protein
MADGKSIVSGWTDGNIRSFLPQSGKMFWIIKDAHPAGKGAYGGVTCICSTQDCESVVSAGIDGEVKLWNIGKQVKKLQSSQKQHQGLVTALKMIDESDSMLASSSLDGTIIIWRVQKLKLLQKLHHIQIPPGPDNGVAGMAYVPHQNFLAVIDTKRRLSYLSLDRMEITHSIEAAYDGQLTCVAYNEQRDELAVGDDAGEIKVFSFRDGRMLHLDQTAHAHAVSALGYSPDGARLVSADSEGKILFWKLNNSK